MKHVFLIFLMLVSGNRLIAQPAGSSLVLNGSSDYASIPHHALMNPDSAMTVEAWIYPCRVMGNNFILGKWWCGGSEQNAYYLVVNDGKLRWGWDFDGCGNGARVYESTATIQANQWQHVAAVHTTSSVTLYLNGLPISGTLVQGSYSAILQNQEPFRIGVYRDISNAYWGHFMGRIDEVRVWDRNLNAAEILARFNAPLLGNEPGLIAYYDMDTTGAGTGLPVLNRAVSTYGILNGSCMGNPTSPYYLSNTLPVLPLDLGNDTALCQGDTIQLNANLPSATWLWQNGSTLPQLTVSQQGLYWVIASWGLCINADTIQVDVNPYPVVDLGPDTSLCAGDTLMLDALYPAASYLWQDGSSLPEYIVVQSGLYWVQVSLNGCTVIDSVYVTFLPVPQVNLGQDTALCEGDTLILDAFYPGASYLWQDGSSSPSYSVTQGGTYWVDVSLGICSQADTIQVGVQPYPVIDLGPDTNLCSGDTLWLDAIYAGASYLWQDGTASPGYVVTQSGSYWVRVDLNGCAVVDSIVVAFLPMPQVDLGQDTILCTGDSILLSGGPAGALYTWQDGSDQLSFVAKQGGTFWVVTDLNGCIASDTLTVTEVPWPYTDIGNDTILCEGTSIVLEVHSGFDNYTWSTGDAGLTLLVVQPDLYWVEVSNECGAYRDSLWVHYKNCNCGLWIPSAFSPNADGINDVFEVKGNCLTYYHIWIYTRWGDLIFESSSLAAPWDGKYKGELCPVSVYTYRIEYQLDFSSEKKLELGKVMIVN